MLNFLIKDGFIWFILIVVIFLCIATYIQKKSTKKLKKYLDEVESETTKKFNLLLKK